MKDYIYKLYAMVTLENMEVEGPYDIKVERPLFLGGGSWSLKGLTPITVIFGKNGSGKSILLRQIHKKNPEVYHYSVPERGGGSISFDASAAQKEFDGKSRFEASKTNFSYEYRSRVVSRINAFLSQRGAIRGPITDDSVTKIEKIMQDFLPDFRFQISGGNPPFQLERLTPRQETVNINDLSSGETELLTLSLDVLLICELWSLNDSNGTLLIDEPDTHLHPDMQQRFAKFLVYLFHEYGCPIIIATHSTTLLSALGHFGEAETSIVYLSNKNQMQAVRFDKFLKVMSTCLGGHALMGPLFSFPILLVEGDDDFKIWSQVPRHGILNIAVINCNGEEIYDYQRTLEKLFSSIMDKPEEPIGFALLDNDKKLPSISQDFIKFIRLSCHESENLYLTDEVMEKLGYSWESACDKIIHESDKYLSKGKFLKQVKDWNRSTVDCKNTVNEIEWILDEKRLPWTTRLGKIIGENKPKGQLREFLGDDVVSSLWQDNASS